MGNWVTEARNGVKGRGFSIYKLMRHAGFGGPLYTNNI
jgi:hypothetical protein